MEKETIVCPFCFSDCEVKDGSCKNCKSLIPPEALTSRLFPIAVVGPSGAGKTHFLTVLAHLLCEGALWPSYWTTTRVIRRVEGGQTGGARRTASPDEFVNWEEKLYPQRGARGTILGQTDARSEAEPPLSLVIHLSYSKSAVNRVKEPYSKKDVLLAFTDTAGEDLTRMGWDAVSKKYPIFGRKLANGLIALINPTQLATIRDECNGGSSALKNRYEQSGLKLSAFATLQSVLSISEIRKSMKRKPIAVCLTKTDALCAVDKLDQQDILASSQDIVARTVVDEGRISLADLRNLSEATEVYLAEMDGDAGFRDGRPAPDGISGSAKFFKYRAFFATDALGPTIQTARLTPEGSRMFTGVPVPRRILDPLLWVLWQYGLVGGCQ